MNLHERSWPVDDPKACVVIVHGLAEHSGRYEYVARKLNEAGYAAHALDLRGHGRSPGFPGDMGTDVDAISQDVTDLCVRLRPSYPALFLLAHSMGTLVSLPAVAKTPAGVLDGLILSGTALVPGQAVLDSLTSGGPIPPEVISRDPEIVEAYRNDDLVFYDRVPMELTMLAAEALGRASDAVPLITVPVLLVHGTEDTVTDMAGAQNVHTQLVITDKTFKGYDGLYHEVLNEPERDQVIADIVAWLDERLPDRAPA
jgi:acylglycerol lipase